MPEYVKIQPQYDPARLLGTYAAYSLNPQVIDLEPAEHERCSGHGRVPLCTLCWANM